MGLNKRTYVNGETVITAENLNDIQDELIRQGEQQDATMIENSASGTIASFNDGANLPVKDLTLAIEAVQDLHGYDHPWVGGAGKNLVYPIMHDSDGSVMNTYTSKGITYTYNSDGSVTAIGTSMAESLSGYAPSATTLAPLRFLPVGTYILSGSFGTNNVTLYAQFRDKSNNVVPVKINGSSYNTITCRGTGTATFTVETECCAYVRADIMSGETVNGTFYPMIRKSTDSATYEPYENICPISGWDEVNVKVVGKNWLEPTSKSGTITGYYIEFTKNSTSAHINEVHLREDVGYRLRVKVSSSVSGFTISAGAGSGSYSRDISMTNASYVDGIYTVYFTPTATNLNMGDIFAFRAPRYTSNQTYTCNIEWAELSIASQNTNNEYSPYNGQTYTIDINGTVYGGTLNVTTGVLTVTHGYVDLGSLNWTKINTASPHWRFCAILNSANPLGTLISSQYIQVTPTAQYTGSQGVATQTSGTNTLVMVSDENYTDATAFKTAMSGVQLVYELATPQTYQLTPVEVLTILGKNNIFADCGDIENVTYRADTKLYIDNAIGGVDELLGSGVIE